MTNSGEGPLVLEEKISEVENELHKTSEEMRKLTVERRKVGSEEPRTSDTSRVGSDWRKVSKSHSSEGEAGPARATERRSSEEPGVGLDQRTSEGDQGSMNGAGNAQTKKRAVVRVWVAPVERYGSGHGREQGGVDLQSQCGEQFGWMT